MQRLHGTRSTRWLVVAVLKVQRVVVGVVCGAGNEIQFARVAGDNRVSFELPVSCSSGRVERQGLVGRRSVHIRVEEEP